VLCEEYINHIDQINNTNVAFQSLQIAVYITLRKSVFLGANLGAKIRLGRVWGIKKSGYVRQGLLHQSTKW
jgi:hypothetical protein